jgi:hypothetical protein
MKEPQMLEDRKSLFRKIKALLAKTTENGCTENEAMAALDKARAMMDAHDISDTDLAFDGEKVERETVDRGKDNIRWHLADGVGKFCDCRVWGNGNSQIVFFGLQSDAIFAGWLLDTLEKFVRRNSLAFLADVGRPVSGVTDLFGAPLNGKDREYKRRSFVQGCVSRIYERLRQAAAERASTVCGNGRALVPVKNALVETAFRELGLSLRKSRAGKGKADFGAFDRGRQAGDRATFGRPVKGGARPLAIGR